MSNQYEFLSRFKCDEWARLDGFSDWPDMRSWLARNHGFSPSNDLITMSRYQWDRFRTGKGCEGKNHYFSFQPQFVSAIKSGEKLTTFRKIRKREVAIGDIINFRQWSGSPYRSRQIVLGYAEIVNVQCVILNWSDGMFVDLEGVAQ